MVSRRQKLQAFTLIELLMVMMIITIMVALIAPKLTAFAAGRKTNDAARTLVTYARYARTQAIGEGRMYRLNLDPSARQFWLTAQQGGEYVAAANEFGQRYTLPDGVAMVTDIATQGDGQYITFRPSGRVDLGATQSSAPTADNGSGNTATVSLTPAGTPVSTTQSAKVEIRDGIGHSVTVACASETELFHILQSGEVVP